MCGGGPDPADFNKPTPQEYAQAETAAKEFNEYLRGKAVEKGYLEDISRDPSITARAVQGQAAADLSQVTQPAVANPNTGMNVVGMARSAGKRAKIMSDIGQDAVSQQAAGKKSFVESAMGLQSTADTAQAGMAADAVRRNLTSAQSDFQSSSAGTSAMSSLAGAGAGMALNLNQKKQ